MNSIWILSTVLYFVLTHLVAKHLGEKRKIGYGKTLFWSLMLTPIIMFLILIIFTQPVKEQ